MKKIVINALSARSGGGHSYIWNLFKHFPINHNFQIYLLTSKKNDLKFIEKIKNVKVYYIKDKGPFIRMLWENIMLPLFCLRNKIDLVFSLVDCFQLLT